ncbi:MAG: carbon starvation protein predicted rane protein [Planctomycetota bacterium]|nr:carbon starvation protein predicted rane protein [Planctomycetota bacterium]
MSVPAMWVMLGVLAILAVAYRYYSAFLAARVAALDDSRVTPAHTRNDGQNFHPTNKWVLFGHHFAAISGAGPLIGPVLAIQFGYLPGLIWLVVGVCLAGAVQDMMVLVASTRRGGQSLAGIAREELGPIAGGATAIAILYVIIIALAGLGIVVVKALGGEEIKMAENTSLTYPKGADITHDFSAITQETTYSVPPKTVYRFGKEKGEELVFQEPFRLAVPGLNPLSPRKNSDAYVLPKGARRLVPGSSWGTFTIFCTIPIALFVGFYMYRFRKGKVIEASIIGAIAVLAATVAGAWIPGSALERVFSLSREETIFAIAAYGFVASVLPVWLLLCPRDYLSSFLKIGTIALLVVGVILANPRLQAPPINWQFAQKGGPYFNGPIFPYVFICIMCGAISGFHALVSSGTTPKMVNKETDIRMIGYGAMLMEGLVGVVALIAAASLPNSMYYDINIDLAQKPKYAQVLKVMNVDHDGDSTELVTMEGQVGESLHGRTGGAVTLAVGMARIFTTALPGLKGLVGFWYHFAIMFEALFILTTIDTGTRIGRFLVQEFLGKLWKPLGNLDWLPASFLATSLVVFAWGYFIYTGSVATIWPMFGMANQLLALIALTIVTTSLVNAGKGRYAPLTLLPALFVATTTLTAAYMETTGTYWSWIKKGDVLKGWLNIGLTGLLVGCVAVIVMSALVTCLRGQKKIIEE